MKKSPIGIFDSGIGGLTIAHAIKEKLPNENIIYFGDTKHLPYGDKSIQSIQKFAKNIALFLKEQKCKMIVIACNTATAVAIEKLRQEFSISFVGVEPDLHFYKREKILLFSLF